MIPENSIIFTSFALAYLPYLSTQFITDLKLLKPKLIINLEPIYPEEENLRFYDILKKRYFGVNKYCKKLMTTLRNCEKQGILNIMFKSEPFIGSNPLITNSLIIWEFNNDFQI